MSKYLCTKLEDAMQAKNIENICKYINKAIKENMQLPAVSIMHMYDEISQFFSENDLKKLGLVVEISQWQLEVEEALKDLENNPQVQTKLKRLHRGFDNMYRAWINGELKNNHLAKILNDAADGQLFELWTTLSMTEADNKEFNTRVTEGYKKQLEELKRSWFTGQVDKEVKTALDLHIIRAFINEWDNPNITDETIKTEAMANAKIVFFSDLKSNKLSNSLYTYFLEKMGEYIFSQLANQKLSKYSLLGSKIESIKEGRFALDVRAAYMDASKMVLQDWISDRIEPGARKQLEELIDEHFLMLVKDMSDSDVYLLKVMAVKDLLDQNRSEMTEDATLLTFKKFGQDIIQAKLHLLDNCVVTNPENEISLLQKEIAKRVVGQVRCEWQTGGLSKKESNFINAHVLLDLKEIDKSIQMMVYPAAMNANLITLFFANPKAKEGLAVLVEAAYAANIPQPGLKLGK